MKAIKRYFDCVTADFYKLLHMKSFYIGLALMAVFTLIVALAMNAAIELLIDNSDEYAALGGVDIATVNNSAAFMMLSAAPSAASVYFLVPIIVALFIGIEFSGGMMRIQAGHGISRTDIYFSKWLTAFVVTLFYLFVAFLFGLFAALALGADSAFFDAYNKTIAKIFGMQIMLSFCMSAIFTAVSFLIRSKAGSVAVLLVMHIVLGSVLTTIVQLALGMNISTTTPESYMYMYLNPYFNISALQSAASMTTKEIGLAMGGCALWFAVFTGVGWTTFAKADVK